MTREAESAGGVNGLAEGRRGEEGGRRGEGDGGCRGARPVSGAGRGGAGRRGRRRRRRNQRTGRGSSPPAFEPGYSRGGERGRGKRQAVTSEPAERIRWESRRRGAERVSERGVSD